MKDQSIEKKNNGFIEKGSRASCFCYEWIELISQSLIFVVFALAFVFRIFTVQGKSMLNTLHNGDKIFVWKYNYTPNNGDVVVIRKYSMMNSPIVKRVIAVEGQTLSIDFESGSVNVDGKKINETYIKDLTRYQGDAEIPSVIPKGSVFVMGDNRQGSTDSRDIGPIPKEFIEGRAIYILYPFYRINSI
ncbi:MAG: signal peptidase I [Firmicutes bacterium]|nr:signal peptidase I [Bacillota bacterium]